MKKHIILFLYLFFIINTIFAQKKNILIIHSYHVGLEWTDDETRGIESVFENNRDSIELCFEYLDTKKYGDNDSVYFNDLANIYKRKYEQKISVIIITDNSALGFIKHYRDTFASGIPIVFCGINDFNDEKIKGIENITGVVENVDYKKNIELILKLQPKTENIIVINDNKSYTSIIHKKLFSEIAKNYNSKVNFIYWEDFFISEIEEKSAKLTDGSVIFLINFHVDKNGVFIDYKELAEKASKKNNVPVYAPFTFFLGKGIIGGMLVSGFKQGEQAGKMALRIFSGENINNIPVENESPNEFMFDYNILKKFNINFSSLPDDRKIINAPKNNIAIKQQKDEFEMRKNYALLFAVNEYDNNTGWCDLKNPISDAEKIAKELVKYEFDTLIVRNPTKADFLKMIYDYAETKYNQYDQLLIFYTGHGEYDDKLKKGYLAFRDSKQNDYYKNNYVSYADIAETFDRMNCNHILFISDACYSGTFFKSIALKGSHDEELFNKSLCKEKLEYKSRLFLGSAGKEKSPDKSVFAEELLNAFRSTNKNNGLSYNMILPYFETIKPQASYGSFGDYDIGGTFIFIKQNNK